MRTRFLKDMSLDGERTVLIAERMVVERRVQHVSAGQNFMVNSVTITDGIAYVVFPDGYEFLVDDNLVEVMNENSWHDQPATRTCCENK